MKTYNDQAKALFPLSLDGRGARGEGVFRSAKIALAALFLAAPTAALADNECGLQVGTTPVDCGDPSYGSGVIYDAVGDLFVDFTNATRSTVGGNGVSLTGDGTESITFDSQSTNTELESSGTTGPLLGVTTVDGDIVIATEELDADQSAAGVTHAIYAESTGTGSIDIATIGSVDASSSGSGTNPPESVGIQAITGSGSLTITASGNVSGNDAAIDATTGTGLLTIDVASGSGSISGGTGIRTNAGGNVVIDIASGRQVSGGMDLTAAGDMTVDNTGRINGGSGVGQFAIQATGNAVVLNNTEGPGNFDGLISGAIDFSGLDDDGDGYIFNNNGTWDFVQGTASSGSSANRQVVSTLGAGTFVNAGTIEFGQLAEVILAPGTAFTGAGDSLFDMRATMDGVGQSSCEAATVAGCLDLAGGSTSGQTSILINSVAPPLDPEAGLTTAANPGILLVDVSGGTSAADHFVLDPGSENYLDTEFYGGVITTGGPLVYTLLYNPNSQQHILGTVPSEEGAEYATFIDEAVSIWHTTADTVAGRQADLRGGATGGGWVRLVSERTTRDTTLAMTTHGNDFTFDVGYEQNTRAALFGFDAMYGDNYVIGLHGGLISSETDYDNTGNDNETKGIAAGVYGGWWRDLGIGQLTVDATVNGNFLKLDHDASFEVTHSDIRSLGVRAEAGWKVPVIDGFYVQPLATVAYVSSNIETMELRQNNISFEDAESQRAALGVRLGGDFEMDSGLTARYWLTGRAWDERAEDGRVEYATTGDPLAIGDDISGSFEEVGFGASLSNKEDSLSVFASGSTKFIDDVTNYNVTVGLRKRW